jgi:ABC-type lipoprotein release transport system permease subunit
LRGDIFALDEKVLARFTSIVAVVGIAAGVASLILAQSLARGFSDEMQSKDSFEHSAHFRF